MIPQEMIDRVREATDIVDLISKYLLLKPSGKGYKGLCPFHQEKTPSFMVNPDRQFFHCFGCGAGGNVFNFLMRAEGLNFGEAVRELAKRSNISLPSAPDTGQERGERERRRLLEAAAWAAERFRQAFTQGETGAAAHAFLRGREVPPELADRFGLGFAPPGWDNLLRAARRDGYSEELLEKAGLVVSKRTGSEKYDRFRNRLMFPIREAQGRTVAFGGRLLEPGEPKYLNSPETEIFRKGDLLYGLDLARDAARKNGRLVLVEGYLDVIACHAAGVTETVASLGTALTPQQARLLRRYAERVILVYDADAAGLEASFRAFEILESEGLGIRAVALAGAKDPDEYCRRFGADAFRTLLERAAGMVDFVLKTASDRHDTQTIEGKVAVVNAVAPTVARLRNLVERQEYTKMLAERLRLDEALVAEEVGRRRRGETGPTPFRRLAPQIRTQAEERLLLGALLRHPGRIAPLREELDLAFFSDPTLRALAARLVETTLPEDETEEDWLTRFLGELDEAPLAESAAGLVADDYSGADPAQVIRDCLKRLQAARLREHIGHLQGQLREADAGGDMEIRKQLQQQELELKNQLKRLGVDWRTLRKAARSGGQ